MKFKMEATAGLSLTLDPMGKMFQNASSLKPLGQLKCIRDMEPYFLKHDILIPLYSLVKIEQCNSLFHFLYIRSILQVKVQVNVHCKYFDIF
jgi:hypothetical protein